jgi:hypothetical protein
MVVRLLLLTAFTGLAVQLQLQQLLLELPALPLLQRIHLLYTQLTPQVRDQALQVILLVRMLRRVVKLLPAVIVDTDSVVRVFTLGLPPLVFMRYL